MGKRIDYIDYLKGLSIMWVVWYHTVHPWFADFSFRIPLFFFASGIFYKIVSYKTYIQKKTNQLIVPFIFFYLIYYVYLILQHYLSQHTLSNFDFGIIGSLFYFYKGNEAFVVDPPLWFICALFCQQIVTWFLVTVLKRRWLIAIVAIGLTIWGEMYVKYQPTLFMFGRSMPYLVYYVFGHLYGKDLISIIENQKQTRAYAPLMSAFLVYGAAIILKLTTLWNATILTYLETFGLIIILIYLFKWIHRYRFSYPFWLFGRNSYIVLGLHEIYLTILTIIYDHLFGAVNVWSGLMLTALTLILLWPTIILMNKYIPYLVGKKEIINYSWLKDRIRSIQ